MIIRIASLLMILMVLAFASNAHARDTVLNIQEVKSPSGITAWLVEDHSVPVISVQFSFKGAGAKNDPANKQGLTRLASNTMDEGAGDIRSQDFQKQLRDHSISLFFNASRDNFGGSLKTLTRHKDKAFDLLRLALNEPRFDDAPVQRMRESNQSRLRRSMSQPNWLAARLMNDRAFEGHPYALNSGGTIATLNSITREDLARFTLQRLAQDNLRIAVAGDITADDLSRVLDEIFSTLPKTSELKRTPPLTLQNQGSVYFYAKDIPQSFIEIMQPAIGRKHANYQYAQIMNFVLGSSGFGSRLTEEIREKRGLTYGIYSSLTEMDAFAGLSTSTSTQGENTAEMLQLIHAEWNTMKDGITEEELQSAKSYLVGALPLSLTSTDQIAKTALSIYLDDLPRNYLAMRNNIIEQATLEDIQNVAENLLNPDQFVTVIVGRAPEGVDVITVEDIPNVE